MNAAEEEKDFFPQKEFSPREEDEEERTSSRILTNDEKRVLSVKGDFSIHKDIGGNDLVAEQFSVTNPHKCSKGDHIEYTLTVNYKLTLRALTQKDFLKSQEDIENSTF